MHTHFGSATLAAAVFIGIVLPVGSLWRLGWLHVAKSRNPHAQGFARAAMFQY